MSESAFPLRGEIYWVDLEPALGGETQKLRPGLIVSNDVGNQFSKIVMIAPITSHVKNVYPFEVKISLKGKPAKIMLNQCRAVDKSRLKGKKIASIDDSSMEATLEAIKIVFGIL